VRVFDIAAEAVASLVEVGAIAAPSVAAVTHDADVVFTMLQTGEQVRNVCLGEQGIFVNAKKSLLYIDSSSIDITVARELHAHAAEKGIAMLDAPVSGGVASATAGTLTIMIGGSNDNFQRAEAVLSKLGKKIIHAGAPGNGQAAKICNNLILGISMVAVSEGFSLAEKLGLDAKVFFDISNHASGQCWAMTNYCPVPGILPHAPASHDYQAGFSAQMMLKDLKLAQTAAASINAALPLGAEAAALYTVFVNQGNAGLDFSGIIRLFK
jgi:3-hydroxyisobutyrate dehydrogenase